MDIKEVKGGRNVVNAGKYYYEQLNKEQQKAYSHEIIGALGNGVACCDADHFYKLSTRKPMTFRSWEEWRSIFEKTYIFTKILLNW